MEEYIRDAKVSDEDVKKRSCARRFRLGITVYLSEVEVMFLIVLKMDENDFVRREKVGNIIKLDEVIFLCGKEMIKD